MSTEFHMAVRDGKPVTCADCIFFVKGTGQCRRLPAWEAHYLSDWCGEWLPTPEVRKARNL